MTNLENLHKQMLEAMNQSLAQILAANVPVIATPQQPVATPQVTTEARQAAIEVTQAVQNNVKDLEKQLADTQNHVQQLEKRLANTQQLEKELVTMQNNMQLLVNQLANMQQLENQLANMQATMQQMMNMINEQQKVILAQQAASIMPNIQPNQQFAPIPPQYATEPVQHHAPIYDAIPPQYATEPVVPQNVVEPRPAVKQDKDTYKVSAMMIKPCESCAFAQTCPIRKNQGINAQCGQETMMNKSIMLQGGKMQARYNFDTNEVELLSNGKAVSVVQDIKSNANKKFISYMLMDGQNVDVLVKSDQSQPNSIYTTCEIQVDVFGKEDLSATAPVEPIVSVPVKSAVDTIPTSIPDVNEDEEERYLTDEELAEYERMYSHI